jgi:hypothetical protein
MIYEVCLTEWAFEKLVAWDQLLQTVKPIAMMRNLLIIPSRQKMPQLTKESPPSLIHITIEKSRLVSPIIYLY